MTTEQIAAGLLPGQKLALTRAYQDGCERCLTRAR